MIYWLAVPATVALAVLDVSAAPSFTWLGVHPDLIVPWLGCWATIRGQQETTVLVAVAGLSLGLLAPEPLGAALLALLPLAGFAALAEQRLVRGRYLFTLLVVLVAGTLYPLLLAVFGLLGGDSLGPPLVLLRIAPRAAMLDGVVAALWYWPLRLLVRRRAPLRGFGRA
jgi:rod shape-determining protein MreD